MSSPSSSFAQKLKMQTKKDDQIEDASKKILKSGSMAENVRFLPHQNAILDDAHKHHRNFDINLYATKKSAAQGLLDLALLMANASQLKHIILTDGDHRFYGVMIGLLSASIILQIIVAIGLLFLARIRIYDYYNAQKKVDEKQEDEADASQRLEMAKEEDDVQKKLKRADFLNNIIVAGIFILTVINVFISAFGLNESPRNYHATARDSPSATTQKA